MADTATATPTVAPAAAEPPKKEAAPKKGSTAKKAPKSPKIKAVKAVAKKPSTHPKISLMVDDAIKGLNERGGSSFKAIKKYIVTKHKVDVEKLAPFMRRYLKSGVKNGTLVQAKGKGANGSFKLPMKGALVKKTAAPVKKVVPKKVGTSPKAKKPAAGVKTKKVSAVSTTENKTPVKKTPVKTKKSATITKKATAPKKTPVKKATKVKVTKSPKPKKVVALSKKPTPKKAAPKKK